MFIYEIARITEAAAIACYPWIGRGEKEKADLAAVNAMRSACNFLTESVTIVIGEGEKDQAPQLYAGEQLGSGSGSAESVYDVAVDPLEGTNYLAKGLPNALAVIGMSRRGSMFDPAPAFYMDKLVVPPAARGKVTPDMSVDERLQNLARALDKDVEQLTVYVLDRPRHDALIEQIHQSGARTLVYPAGDVVGAILAASDDERVDALMGTGGSPEGILTACAVKAMGGDFFARVDPQIESEKKKVAEAGMSSSTWLELEQVVAGEESHFCATGITAGGLWLPGVEKHEDGSCEVQSCLISTSLDSPVFLERRHPAPVL